MTGLQKALGALALLVALVAGGVIGAAGIGHKYGAWDFNFAWNTLVQYGFFAAVAAGGTALLAVLLGLVRGKMGGVITALFAAIIAAGVAYVPWTMREQAAALPAITDVSTDTATPPAYVNLKSAREATGKGIDYPAANAAIQKSAYPDIVTFVSRDNAAALFGKASAAVKKLGWQIAESVPEEGRIEATAVSEWFGFKEDIVIRIEPEGAGAKLDMRSASRAGTTDFGANAEHIRSLVALVK